MEVGCFKWEAMMCLGICIAAATSNVDLLDVLENMSYMTGEVVSVSSQHA